MSATLKPAPVRKTLTVDVPQDVAFKVFTERFDRWWPASHSIGSSKLTSAVIEPRVGGRWYEIGEDGARCQWGDVLAWEPPSRVVLAWRIGIDWKYDPALLTEVEVRFIAQGSESTRVELEHRLLENMGMAGEAARQIFESDKGWTGILASYAQAVKAA